MVGRVLIFDDDALIRKLLQEVCEQHGYEVFTFDHPGICPLHASNECPCGPENLCADAIISDLQMPVLKGLDFIESLLGKGCHCRHIALMTGYSSEEDVRRATQLGCKVFIKPFGDGEFEDWLEQVKHDLPSNRCLYDWQSGNLTAQPPPGTAEQPPARRSTAKGL